MSTSPQLVQIMTASSGVAPTCLLEILTQDQGLLYVAQQQILAPSVMQPAAGLVNYFPWLSNVGKFQFSRSMQANVGTLTLQNITGDTLRRDVSGLLIRYTFENALFVLREWYPEGETAGFEMHGRLSVDDVSESEAAFTCTQMFNPSAYETPPFILSETCQWRYASKNCGADGTNPCDNTFTTCRVPERFGGVLNTFTQDQTPGVANISSKLTNYVRQF